MLIGLICLNTVVIRMFCRWLHPLNVSLLFSSYVFLEIDLTKRSCSSFCLDLHLIWLPHRSVYCSDFTFDLIPLTHVFLDLFITVLYHSGRVWCRLYVFRGVFFNCPFTCPLCTLKHPTNYEPRYFSHIACVWLWSLIIQFTLEFGFEVLNNLLRSKWDANVGD